MNHFLKNDYNKINNLNYYKLEIIYNKIIKL